MNRPNQMWAGAICYIPMAKGFMYLTVILDWYSRRVLAWRVSNTLDTDPCVATIEEALAHYGAPDASHHD
jgi:putative transposase